MTLVYCFRHGETDYNRDKRLQGQCDRSILPDVRDMPLNETGLQQAHKMADIIRERGVVFDAVLSSPLRRAAQTAEIIADGVQVTHLDGLKEMFFGPDWDGMVLSTFKQQQFVPPHIFIRRDNGQQIAISDGAVLRDWHKKTDPAFDDLSHPGGETKAEVRIRATYAIEDFLQHHAVSNIGMVSHNALMRFVLGAIDPKLAEQSFGHTDMIVLSVTPGQPWQFVERLTAPFS